MVDKNDVAAVLELIRPSLQADGGDVKLIDVDEDGVVTVQLQGACDGCPMASMICSFSPLNSTVTPSGRASGATACCTADVTVVTL